MNILVTIERDNKQTISNITMYLSNGEIICDFYGITDMIIEWVENDRDEWPLDNPLFQQAVFFIYETPHYVSFKDLGERKEDVVFCGTGLELLKRARVKL